MTALNFVVLVTMTIKKFSSIQFYMMMMVLLLFVSFVYAFVLLVSGNI